MGVTPVAIDEQTRFTNPCLVLCHSRCGSSTEWEPLPPIRTTRGSYCSVATPANRCGLPSSHGYTSARVRNNQQGSFDRDEEGEPAVHVLGVSLGFDRHENMVGQLGRRMKRRSYNCGKESRETMYNTFFLHLERHHLHATLYSCIPSISGSLHATSPDIGT